MWSISINLMKKNIRMLIPAGIAILIGTAFIAATFLFGNTMNDSLRTMMTAQFGGANYVVMPTTDNTESYKLTVADLNLDKVAAIDGVDGVRADVTSGANATKGDKHTSLAVVSTSSDASLLPVSITEGRQPENDNEIALPIHAMNILKASMGDTISLAVPNADDEGQSGSIMVTIVGVSDDPNGAYSYTNGAAVLSNNAIAEITDGSSDFNDVRSSAYYIDVDEAKSSTTIQQIRDILPSSMQLMDRDEAADLAIESMANGTNIMTMFLLGFGILAMFVAALVIANTFQVLVAQQRRTLALLRTIGAKKGQLYRSVLAQAGLLGAVASLLGIAFGIALMAVVTNVGALSFLELGRTRLVLSWPVFVVPLVFGVVITILASLGSARTATNVTPLEALRPLELSVKRSGWVRAVSSILMIVLGAAATSYAVWKLPEMLADTHRQENAAQNLLLTAILGCILIFLGLVISAVYWMPWLMRGVGALVSLTGPAAKVANANVQKNHRRVAATGTALLIGVTLVTCIATGAASAKETINSSLDSHYSVDVVLDGEISQDTAKKVAAADGVDESLYAPMGYATVSQDSQTDDSTTSVTLIGIDSIEEVSRVIHVDLTGVTLNDDDLLLAKYSADTAQELQFKDNTAVVIPMSMDLQGGDGESSEMEETEETFHVEQADFRQVTADGQTAGFVKASQFDDGTLSTAGQIMLVSVDTSSRSLADTFQNIQDIASDEAGIYVAGPIAERQEWENVINTMMALLVGLLAVAVLIALIGVANTLSLSVIERTRESATLRAIGMTKGQLRRSLAVEALLLALVSGVVGIVLGTAFGWLGAYIVFSDFGQVQFRVDWVTTITVLVVAAVAALLASVLPAKRAVRTSPVAALAEA